MEIFLAFLAILIQGLMQVMVVVVVQVTYMVVALLVDIIPAATVLVLRVPLV
jgi:hypothetical protein